MSYDEDTETVIDDLIHDFNNLSQRTVSLSTNLRSLLGKQRKIGCEMKQITHSLKEAKCRTEEITSIFHRSSKRELCVKGRVKDDVGGANCSHAKIQPEKKMKLDEQCPVLPQGHSTQTEAHVNGLQVVHSPQLALKNIIHIRETFPKELLLVTNGEETKLYRLCDAGVNDIVSKNKEMLSCNIIQVHIDGEKQIESVSSRREDDSSNETMESPTQTPNEPEEPEENSEVESDLLLASISLEKLQKLVEEEDVAYERLKKQLEDDLQYADVKEPLKKEQDSSVFKEQLKKELASPEFEERLKKELDSPVFKEQLKEDLDSPDIEEQLKDDLDFPEFKEPRKEYLDSPVFKEPLKEDLNSPDFAAHLKKKLDSLDLDSFDLEEELKQYQIKVAD